MCWYTCAGGVALRKSLERNFNECSIKTLCISDGERCQVQCFPKASPLEACMEGVWIMTVKFECSIFNEYWNMRSKSVVGNDFSLADVTTEVWRPVFSHCEKLLASLMDCSISLTMVNQLFHQVRPDIIEYNIKQLQRGVEWCQGRKNVDFTWIGGVINRMNQFWKLSGYTDAAQAFLKIRDALELTGDFLLVENVASRVRTCIAVTLITQPLSINFSSWHLPPPTGYQLDEGSDIAVY